MKNGHDGDIYHISTNEVISIHDLVAKICSKIGARFEDHVEVVGERMGKDSAYHLDSTKLRTELDWKDHIALEQGLDECIIWVRDNFDALKAEHYDYIHKP
jgi:dTDP-glucose 4,6-dehydratase